MRLQVELYEKKEELKRLGEDQESQGIQLELYNLQAATSFRIFRELPHPHRSITMRRKLCSLHSMNTRSNSPNTLRNNHHYPKQSSKSMKLGNLFANNKRIKKVKTNEYTDKLSKTNKTNFKNK